MKRSSVRPSVCPIDRQQQRRAAGLLLSAVWSINWDPAPSPKRQSGELPWAAATGGCFLPLLANRAHIKRPWQAGRSWPVFFRRFCLRRRRHRRDAMQQTAAGILDRCPLSETCSWTQPYFYKPQLSYYSKNPDNKTLTPNITLTGCGRSDERRFDDRITGRTFRRQP